MTVETTAQLHEHVVEASRAADAVVMAAAPADFRPDRRVAPAKIKKTDDGTAPDIRLTQNPDILAEPRRGPPNGQIVVVGFAAETGDETGTVMAHAPAKLTRKRCDLLVVNDVGGGAVFGSEETEAVVLAADGSAVSVPLGSKAALAHVIWDRVLGAPGGKSAPAASAPAEHVSVPQDGQLGSAPPRPGTHHL